VFFVLSGFVLYGVLAPETAPGYSSYAAKRLLRLWLPVAAAVLVSAVLYILVRPTAVPGTSGWFVEKSWTEPPSLMNLACHLALFNSDQYHQLDNPIWSLAHEIKISLIFPFVVLLVKRRPVATVIGACAISIAAAMVPQPAWLSDTFDPAGSLYYLFLFVAGAAIAARREAITVFAASEIGRNLTRPVLLLSLILLCSTARTSAGYGVSAGAVILIGISATSPAIGQALERRVLVWLGRVSYSLYLVHIPILLMIVHLLGGVVPLPLLLALVPIVSLGAAELFSRTVEQPSLRLAARVGARQALARAAHSPVAC